MNRGSVFVRNFAKKAAQSPAPAAPSTGAASVSSGSGKVGGPVAIPLRLFGIPGRYATALFSAAAKRGELDVVESDLIALSRMSEKAKHFMKDPTVSKKAKSELVTSDISKSSTTELTKNFVGLLAENGRLAFTDKIAEAYGKLMQAHRGEVEVTVTSADKLNDTQIKAVSKALQGYVKKDQTVKIATKVDPSIIGGLVVDLGDKQIDLSIIGRVQRLRTAIAQPF
ncbi:mitochondrial Complex V (CV) F1Fo ATP synthase Fo subunit OSCP (Atp5/AtpH) [Andalucia godoyi]|uniref:Mitochondrial Complex V (CV) F1Fo ATP synthase Fo subunit OSCP (Atp5/AtpH) n=1 Tax=Andalucia godoyi TaxID=505711 RepID=A0A8K0F0J8_ANDGO|nr:mitochondrial Complex V (CV) F1Fo ATP synthase Fo subunit OSCP (Atp5/AtpH) [Andalucia godoyi]|eukprot:ANDGO_07741.mRNA.1 mitochondrial Complex V (CV) F1Fo ATP synthase Fo subunit OSCP (Atp5/AtpH)